MFMCQLIGFGEKEKEKAKIDDRGWDSFAFWVVVVLLLSLGH
jgi:hypothetical protein